MTKHFDVGVHSELVNTDSRRLETERDVQFGQWSDSNHLHVKEQIDKNGQSIGQESADIGFRRSAAKDVALQ